MSLFLRIKSPEYEPLYLFNHLLRGIAFETTQIYNYNDYQKLFLFPTCVYFEVSERIWEEICIRGAFFLNIDPTNFWARKIKKI